MKKLVTLFLIITVFLMLLSYFRVKNYFIQQGDKLQSQIQALYIERNKKFYPVLRADLAKLAQFQLKLEYINTGKNAAEYLNSLFEWKVLRSSSNQKGISVQNSTLQIPASLQLKFKNWKKDWPKFFDDLEVKKIQLDWFSRLHEFQYWDIGELAYKNTKDNLRYSYFPVVKLQNWIKLRLLASARDKDYETAAKDIYQIIRLLYSTEDTLLFSHTQIYFRIIHDFIEYWQQEEKVEQYLIIPNVELLKSFTMVLLSFKDAFHFLQDLKILEGITTSFGFCLAASTGLQEVLLYRSFYEKEFPAYKKYFDTLLNSSRNHCRFKHERAIWNNKGFLSKKENRMQTLISNELHKVFPRIKNRELSPTAGKVLSLLFYDQIFRVLILNELLLKAKNSYRAYSLKF